MTYGESSGKGRVILIEFPFPRFSIIPPVLQRIFFFHFTLLLSEGRAGKYNVLPDVGNAARESIPALNFTTASSKFSRKYCKCVYSL